MKKKENNRLFIIDDDEDDINLFFKAINTISPTIEYDSAKDCFEALQKLSEKEELPDMVFLDLNLPKKDGKSCLAELKSNDTLKHIPVIIYSTSNSLSDFKDTKLLGAKHFITKPTRFSELCDILAAVVIGKLPDFGS